MSSSEVDSSPPLESEEDRTDLSTGLEEFVPGDDSLYHLQMDRSRSNWSKLEEPIDDEKVITGFGIHSSANVEVLVGPYRSPAVELALLNTEHKVCITCGARFTTRGGLHTHQTRHRHIMGQLEGTARLPKYECRSCEAVITVASMLKHKCFTKQQIDMRQRKNKLDANGSPLVCIICRGRMLPSRVHLMIHMIVAHSVHRDPYRCVFCQAEFKSESLLMQETHAFECHAPELFMLSRKANYKMIRDPSGNIMEASSPFVCFYDPTNLEDTFNSNAFRSKRKKATSESTPQFPKRRMCTYTFKTLDEYTAHICCFHGALMPSVESVDEATESVLEVIRQQKRSRHIPGPTVRELLKSQATSGMRGSSGGVDGGGGGGEEEDLGGGFATMTHHHSQPGASSPTMGKKKSIKDTGRSMMSMLVKKRSKRSLVEASRSGNYVCRICLESYSDSNKLKEHVIVYHLPESKKRLKHLAAKHQLSNLLNMDLLCTECYTMYPSYFDLQVHMMVSHAGKDWRHCGLCNYEFFSETGSTPSHLKLIKFDENDILSAPDRRLSVVSETTDGTSRSIIKMPPPAPATTNTSSSDSWPFPADLMWRMIITHETRHREQLFPPRQLPYMPTALLDHLLAGRAIQGILAYNWLVKRTNEEIEGGEEGDKSGGVLGGEEEPLVGTKGPVTTEQAFSITGNRIDVGPLDPEAIEEAKHNIAKLIWQQSTGDDDDDGGMTTHESSHRQQQQRKSNAGSGRASVVTASGRKLPGWIARLFSEIGEQNASKQGEMDFADQF